MFLFVMLLIWLFSCLVLLLFLVLLLGWLLRNFWCHWLSAQFGNWHACSAVLMCCSSLFSNSCVEDNIFALFAYVLYRSSILKEYLQLYYLVKILNGSISSAWRVIMVNTTAQPSFPLYTKTIKDLDLCNNKLVEVESRYTTTES